MFCLVFIQQLSSFHHSCSSFTHDWSFAEIIFEIGVIVGATLTQVWDRQTAPSSPPVGWVGSNNNTLHPVTSHQDGLRSLFPSITNLATSSSFIYLTSGGRLRHSLHRVSCWVSQCGVQRLCLSVIIPSLSQLLRITVNLTNTSRYEVFDLASGRAQLVDSACLIRQESLKERQKSSVRSSSVCGCALTPSQCD